MNTKFTTQLVKASLVFAGLLILGVGMTAGSRYLSSPFEQGVLMSIGGAIVAGSLAFFLVEAFRLDRER